MSASNPLSKLPAWLGFLLLMLIGVALVIWGSLIVAEAVRPAARAPKSQGTAMLIAGLTATAISVISWIAGATSKVAGKVGDIGVKVEIQHIPTWTWIVDVVLLVAGFVAIALVLAL